MRGSRGLATRTCALVLVALSIASCREQPEPLDVPSRYGLARGSRHERVVQQAIALTNAILPREGPVHLREASDERSSGAEVFLVRGDALGATEYVFVPAGDRCVFVNDDRLDAALRLFAGNPAGALAVPAEDALALMLLHECGHLAAGDAGSYTPPVALSVDDLTATVNVSKSRELGADAFAVDAIRAAAVPGRPMERFMAATRLELALTKISWNLATRRLLDEFAANALRERRLFLDRGYSHPNFELRFLVMNYRLQPTEEGRSLLADFIEGRRMQPAGGSLLGIPPLQ